MLSEETDKYEQRLSAIAGTRLIFNSLEELEIFLGNRAIHSNGIRRCFPSPQKLRSAYRDLKVEVSLMTDDLLDLDWLMRHYERAWDFYRSYLARRKNTSDLATRLLEYHYSNGAKAPAAKGLNTLFEEVERRMVNVPLLCLLLLKALPGWDSKAGDATDLDECFGRVLDFLERFTAGGGFFDVLPVIRRAREEACKTRLMLIHHTIGILDVYESYSNTANILDAVSIHKANRIALNLAGFWSTGDTAEFWQIEHTADPGVFFATQYTRESGCLLRSVRFVVNTVESEDNRVMAFFMHPLAMKHRLQGIPYSDVDTAWYRTDRPSSDAPEELIFSRSIPSKHWPDSIKWQRVGAADLPRYKAAVRSAVLLDPYEECSYTLTPSIYAITLDAVYVFDPQEECFYRLPRDTEHEFEKISLDDNVGILEIGSSQRRRYLAIDERLLYIPLTDRALTRYGITRAFEID